MNLYFRLFILILRAIFRRKRIGILDELQSTFRVLPNDLDINLHMNNGRYLAIMDLARLDYTAHAGLLQPMIRYRWFPVLGASQMVFLRPLSPFQKYVIHTRLECWDEKWFLMVQRFEAEGKVCAYGKIRGLFRGPEGNVSPYEVLRKSFGIAIPSPEPSEATKLWIQSVSAKTWISGGH